MEVKLKDVIIKHFQSANTLSLFNNYDFAIDGVVFYYSVLVKLQLVELIDFIRKNKNLSFYISTEYARHNIYIKIYINR